MADKFLNLTAVQVIKTWATGLFASKTSLETLQEEVEDIIAEGGEPNVIETIKRNGTAITPDANKAVDISIPVSTSELVNNGDGQSNFATEDYVANNGGKIDVIKVNGATQTITNKSVDITVPVAVSDLTNDSGFQSASDVSTAITTALQNSGDAYQTGSDVETAIDNALADITGIDFEVVNTLPATGEKGIIYLLSNSGVGGNTYDEYIWIDGNPSGHFEKIGTTDVDLSNYWTSTTGQSNTLEAATVAEINAVLNQ